jgi:hypothetical protein
MYDCACLSGGIGQDNNLVFLARSKALSPTRRGRGVFCDDFLFSPYHIGGAFEGKNLKRKISGEKAYPNRNNRISIFRTLPINVGTCFPFLKHQFRKENYHDQLL